MHACLLKAKKILEVGVQGSKFSIYTYLTYHSLHDNWKVVYSTRLIEKIERNVMHLFHPRLKYKYNEAKI